jgi:phospholipid/cholesterol/gamma-HCH transport system substrate-binding protein
LSLQISNKVKVPIDSMASVKSQGIIGDKYIQLGIGGDEEFFKPGDLIEETESSVDIESLISKFAFGSAE